MAGQAVLRHRGEREEREGEKDRRKRGERERMREI